jgi:hypothetical protein
MILKGLRPRSAPMTRVVGRLSNRDGSVFDGVNVVGTATAVALFS